MEIKKNKLEHSNILPLIINMSIPPTISMLINSLYNIVDSIFVARLGSEAINAITLAFPIQNIILAMAVGCGIGINSYMSRKLGEKNYAQANNTANNALFLTFLHLLAVIILGAILIKPFFNFFSPNPATLDMCLDYTYIVTFGCIGLLLQVTVEKILQATGDMKSPMYVLIISSIINIILDPIFIFGYFGFPALGVKGAALATITGQIIGGFVALWILFYKTKEVKISWKEFTFDKNIAFEIYKLAIPSFFIMSIISILVAGINSILSSISKVAISVFGIYIKLQTFIYMPTNGIAQGVMPIIGYNYGAKNKTRVIETLKYSTLICMILNFSGTLLFLIFPKIIIQFFTSDPVLVKPSIICLRIISLGYLFGSISYVISCFLQAIGYGMPSLIITLLRQLILLLPLAYILGKFWGIFGVWWSFPIAEVLTCLISYFIYLSFKKRDKLLQIS